MSEDDNDWTIKDWHSSPEYCASELCITSHKFFELTNLLLERPNLNSSHLFRADVISDSAGILKTVSEKGLQYDYHHHGVDISVATSNKFRTGPVGKSVDDNSVVDGDHKENQSIELFKIPDFTLTRTVVRKLIPRKPYVDRVLEQTCSIYTVGDTNATPFSIIVVYIPHVKSENEMPWYHPKVRALAYRYDHNGQEGTLSVHYKPFSEPTDPIESRLHRTFLSLLQTFIRLSRLETPPDLPISDNKVQASDRLVSFAALKDTILPQHIVQNTYTRLKQTYASDLISRWVEITDPSKHVFEDIAIAAFMIELWKIMYQDDQFPGFIDIACGNGVLVYILNKEGFGGYGFDARKRKTWDILGIPDRLDEMLCIPKPFLDVLVPEELENAVNGVRIHNGTFRQGTFVISNHADELTPWTPILAALSSPENHLPFISIPCCSHALNGGKHRYTFKDINASQPGKSKHHSTREDDQPSTGDLKAHRAQKKKAQSHNDDKSTYACLTKKTTALAEELGFKTELTLLRIPSTRNIGIVGNRHRTPTVDGEATTQRISDLLARECGMTGGLHESALAWVERARKLVGPQSRGKLNLGSSLVQSTVARND